MNCDCLEHELSLLVENPSSLAILDKETKKKSATNKFLSRILDTNFYFDVKYIFSSELVLKLLQKYEKLSNDLEGNEYHRFLRPIDVKYTKLNNSTEVRFRIELERLSDNDEYWISIHDRDTNLIGGHLEILDPNLVCEFLRELTGCIIGIDKDDIISRINYISNEIEEYLYSVKSLTKILSEF